MIFFFFRGNSILSLRKKEKEGVTARYIEGTLYSKDAPRSIERERKEDGRIFFFSSFFLRFADLSLARSWFTLSLSFFFLFSPSSSFIQIEVKRTCLCASFYIDRRGRKWLLPSLFFLSMCHLIRPEETSYTRVDDPGESSSLQCRAPPLAEEVEDVAPAQQRRKSGRFRSLSAQQPCIKAWSKTSSFWKAEESLTHNGSGGGARVNDLSAISKSW